MREIAYGLVLLAFALLLVFALAFAFAWMRHQAGCDGYAYTPVAEIPGRCLHWYAP